MKKYSNFNIEEDLTNACENGKQRDKIEQERRIAAKVLKKDNDNMKYLNRAFPYISEKHMINTVKGLYPDLNELFIVNLDDKDKNGTPLLKTRNLRSLTISHLKYSNGRCDVDACFRLLLALIMNGTVYIKSATLSNGYWNRRF